MFPCLVTMKSTRTREMRIRVTQAVELGGNRTWLGEARKPRGSCPNGENAFRGIQMRQMRLPRKSHQVASHVGPLTSRTGGSRAPCALGSGHLQPGSGAEGPRPSAPGGGGVRQESRPQPRQGLRLSSRLRVNGNIRQGNRAATVTPSASH